MTDEGSERPEVSFGGFSIEGLDDPLASRAPEPSDYVEEIDDDPAPMLDLGRTYDPERRPGFGASPWSGASDARSPGRRGGMRTLALVAVAVVVVGVAATLVFQLLG